MTKDTFSHGPAHLYSDLWVMVEKEPDVFAAVAGFVARVNCFSFCLFFIFLFSSFIFRVVLPFSWDSRHDFNLIDWAVKPKLNNINSLQCRELDLCLFFIKLRTERK